MANWHSTDKELPTTHFVREEEDGALLYESDAKLIFEDGVFFTAYYSFYIVSGEKTSEVWLNPLSARDYCPKFWTDLPEIPEEDEKEDI